MTILTEQNESLDAGKLKRIHINQHNIKYNAKNDDKKPVITIKSGKHNTYAYKITIKGDSDVIYSPNKPLSCGAKVWIETKAKVELDGQNTN